MSKKKVLLRGVFINRDTNGEGVLKVGTTLIRVSTVMGILYVNGSLLSRIFSNLTNNICKYADIDEQVVMETVYSKNIFEICISNTVCKEKSLLESTGLGLKNVELLMRRMHGRAIYETKE